MTDPMRTDHQYTMGYSPEFLQLLERRNAGTHAAHLLAQLHSGMHLLDFGCGPGTITVGLAAAVYPGKVHGIDMEESQIEMARAAAAAGGHDNITFHVGNVYELPFEDNYFDAAHCHAVLMHVPDTQTALKEVKRVLKPYGILASREMIAGSSFIEPVGEHIPDAWITFTKLLAANGGHPEMGKELKRALLQAGFGDIKTSGSFDYFDTAEEISFLHAFISDWFFMPEVVTAATQYGLATRDQFDQWRFEIEQWKGEEGAVGGLAFGEAVSRKL